MTSLTAGDGLVTVELQFGGDDMITLTENATKHIKTLRVDQGVQDKPLRVYMKKIGEGDGQSLEVWREPEHG